jgi:hypothetical protein
MKQYTTPEQTAKLIELGFEKPKMAAPALKWVDGEPTFEPQYTIGELFDLLPTIAEGFTLWVGRDEISNQWFAKYAPRTLTLSEELIDALFDMIVKLKEEGRYGNKD